MSSAQLDSLDALSAELASVVAAFESIPAPERKRYRIQAGGDRGHLESILNLVDQRPNAVAPDSQRSVLKQFEALRDRAAFAAEQLRAVLVRVEDVATLAGRELHARLSAARGGLKLRSRYASADLRGQLERAGARYRPRGKKARPSPSDGAPNPPTR